MGGARKGQCGVARGAHEVEQPSACSSFFQLYYMSAMALRRAAWSVVLGVKCARLSPALTVAIASPCRRHHCGGDMASWRLDSTVTERYMRLDQGSNVLATYIWIDGTGVVRGGGGRREDENLSTGDDDVCVYMAAICSSWIG